MESGEENRRATPNEPVYESGNCEWSSKRIETTYQEARAVLEAQQTTVADIDEKAMRTVRTTVLLIGAIASAVKVAEVELHAGLATLGSVFLFGSLAFGLATYDETDPYLGPNQGYLEQLAANEFRKRWEEDIIETYGYWIKKNGEDIEFNSLLLRITQALLFLGMALLSLSLVF